MSGKTSIDGRFELNEVCPKVLYIADGGRLQAQIVFHHFVQLIVQFLQLMLMVQVFNRLFEADGDEQAEDDGGDVDEEVAPGAGGVVGGVDVEHVGGLLLRSGGFRRGDELVPGLVGGSGWRRLGQRIGVLIVVRIGHGFIRQ
jgi:hypothetical protein